MRLSLPSRLLLLAATLPAAAPLLGQMHKVEAPKKVTRAVGVYEWTGDLAKPLAARLIPVSVFIDAQMQDGGTYYARPVPLALQNGNIYSLEKAGVPQGTVTLDFARHLQVGTGSNMMTDLGWFGYGTYATLATQKTHVLKAAATLPKIHSSKGDDPDDDRPTFQRNGPADKTDSKDKKKDKKEPEASVTPVTDSGDDPDRPHFGKKPSDSSTTTTSSDPSQPSDSGRKTDTTAADPSVDPDRPTLKHRDPKQAAADRKNDRGRVSAAGGALADDPDRPTMRHGKTAGIGGDPAPQMTGLPADLHQMVAVSDPANRDPHPFARNWASPEEQATVTAKLADLARIQILTYNRTNSADAPPPPPVKPVTRNGARPMHHTVKPTPVAPPLPLADEQITGYTLMYGGQPTFVYTATSPAPPSSPTAQRYVTIVAQLLSTGELQLSFATVTDAQHLDRTPWFRLVDAVDPTASNRASLLFELRAHSTRQFALYSLASAHAQEQFVTHVNE